MKTLRTPLSLFLALVVGLVAWTGCDDSGSNAETTGSMTLRLTDAPLDDVDSVVVTIDRITLVPADEDDADDGNGNGEGDDADDDADDDGVFTVYEGPLTVDLLSLQDSTTLLAEDAQIPEGSYSQLRLVLGSTNYLVFNDGSRTTLTTPSAQQSGYKILLGDAFTIDEPSDRIDLTLDFDASQSIVATGNGRYLLKPVIRPTEVLFNDGEMEAPDVEVAGAVDAADAADSTLTVEAVSFDVTADTEYEDATGLSDLAPGAFVGVEAMEADDGTYDALEVERVPENEARFSYEGTLDAVGTASLDLLGVTVRVDTNTVFEGDALTGLGDLQVGSHVEVEFTTDDSGTRVATNVELEDD